jgi:hypothetical protein
MLLLGTVGRGQARDVRLEAHQAANMMKALKVIGPTVFDPVVPS